MPIETTEVRRDSIRHAPHSNTEFNVERLPDAKSIEGMELRFRHEQPLGPVGKHPFLFLATFSALGLLYALAWSMLPSSLEWLWQKLQETEGMPVVGGMVGALVLILLGLLLVFVPKELRRAFFVLTVPASAVSYAAS